MKKLLNKTAYSFLLLSLSSCATVMHGTHQAIEIDSCPSNANVWVDTLYVGNTPMVLDLSRKDQHRIMIALDGYEPYEVLFSRKISGWVFGNIIFGGFIGLAVDAISGGIYMLTPDQVRAQLCSNPITASQYGELSYFAVVLQPDPSWRKIGNLVAAN